MVAPAPPLIIRVPRDILRSSDYAGVDGARHGVALPKLAGGGIIGADVGVWPLTHPFIARADTCPGIAVANKIIPTNPVRIDLLATEGIIQSNGDIGIIASAVPYRDAAGRVVDVFPFAGFATFYRIVCPIRGVALRLDAIHIIG